MSTVQTQSTTDDTSDTDESTLLKGLKNDEKQDTRKCPHEHCHGNLSVIEHNNSEMVICQSCRCTPDGTYYEPKSHYTPPEGGLQESFFYPNGSPCSTFKPQESEWDDHLQWRGSGDRERYRNSNIRKVVGSFESAYPDEMTSPEDSII